MGWEFLDCFAYRRYLARLVFKEPARFPWFHGPTVCALLCRAISRHPLGPDIAPYLVESGVIDYCAGEAYRFGVTLFGPADGMLDRMAAGLRREGETPYPSGGIIGTLRLTARLDDFWKRLLYLG